MKTPGSPTADTRVTSERHGEILVITIANGPVNALSSGVPQEIVRLVNDAQSDPTVRAIIITGEGKMFCGGADITEFVGLDAARASELSAELQGLFYQIELSGKIVVAAINGPALGGGLELAMACHYRFIASTAVVGQPEVKLGLIPGAGGTQRLPRLVGVPRAIEMCAQGDSITAAQALEFGLVDVGAGLDRFLDQAITFAREQVGKGVPLPRTVGRTEKLGLVTDYAAVFEAARGLAAKRAPGLPAPLAAIAAVKAAVSLKFADGCAKERELFAQCLASPEGRELVNFFLAEREIGKVRGITRDTPRREIKSVGVYGAGTMGGGIAMAFAAAGYRVLLTDTNDDLPIRVQTQYIRWLEQQVEKGRMRRAQADGLKNNIVVWPCNRLICPEITDGDWTNVDLVVEAVFEDMAVKRVVFSQLDQICKSGCIFASNTSTLNIDDLAAATNRPSDVIGLHFFAPANIMKLLEIVRGKATRPEVIATAMEVGKRLKKVSVVVGNCFGFAANRVLMKYLELALRLMNQGVSPYRIDAALKACGFRMGPFEMMDLSGLTVIELVQKAAVASGVAGITCSPVITRLVAAGRTGQKAGAGFYNYNDKLKATPDPEGLAQVTGIELVEGQPTEEIIAHMCREALEAEAHTVVADGIVERAGDLNVIFAYGYGVPPHLGIPLRAATA